MAIKQLKKGKLGRKEKAEVLKAGKWYSCTFMEIIVRYFIYNL